MEENEQRKKALREMFAENTSSTASGPPSPTGEGVQEVKKETTEENSVDVGAQSSARYSIDYINAKENSDIIALIDKVKSDECNDNEKVVFGKVSNTIAEKIFNLTNIDVKDFKMAIEARQIFHILKGHGENGMSDHSMANPSDIAKMEYIIDNHDDISYAGQTQAYKQKVDGKTRAAKTVLYEKRIGKKSYYVVQAVPDTKAKTLYIVTAFIGKIGYKKEASQIINAKNLDVTSKNESVNTSTIIIRENTEKSTENAKKVEKSSRKSLDVEQSTKEKRDSGYVSSLRNYLHRLNLSDEIRTDKSFLPL